MTKVEHFKVTTKKGEVIIFHIDDLRALALIEKVMEGGECVRLTKLKEKKQ